MTRTNWLASAAVLLGLGAAATRAQESGCTLPSATGQACAAGKCAIKMQMQAPVSLNFEDVPLRHIFADLQEMSGVNIVADEACTALDGHASLTVENVPFASALDFLLKTVRLTYVIEDDGVRITPVAQSSATDRERAIEQRLLTRVSVNINEVPLHVVIDNLREMGGFYVTTDKDALAEAGISGTEPLSLRVEDMSLKSVMNILLKQVHLTYVIKDECVQITTLDSARGKLQTVTYPVADLIVPIGSGESELAPFLCRMKPEHGNRTPGATAEDVLIRLISETIEPATWRGTGGKGTIQYFPLGQSIVVNQTQDIQEQILDLLAALRRLQEVEDKEYRLEAKLVEVVGGLEKQQSWPAITFVRGQQIQVATRGPVQVQDGTLKDFLPAERSPLSAPVYPNAWQLASTDGVRPASNPVTLEVGMSLKAKVTAAEGGQLRLDATFQTGELTEVTPEGMSVAQQSFRLIHRVEAGKPVKLLLSRDERGDARKWVELTVTETELPKKEEVPISFGNLPPIPR
jgi:hypothetical protein